MTMEVLTDCAAITDTTNNSKYSIHLMTVSTTHISWQ